jgi:hypothetical protein
MGGIIRKLWHFIISNIFVCGTSHNCWSHTSVSQLWGWELQVLSGVISEVKKGHFLPPKYLFSPPHCFPLKFRPSQFIALYKVA